MILGELKYEIDSLYVSTEIILNGKYRVPPLDGLLLEACLVHFRIVWDFFYSPSKRKRNDVLVGNFVPQANFDQKWPASVDKREKFSQSHPPPNSFPLISHLLPKLIPITET